MNKNYFIAAICALFAFTTSCETEPVDPYISGIHNPVLNPSSTDYLPRELNNEWHYKTNGVLETAPYKISGSANIEAGAWYIFDGSLFLPKNTTADSFLRKVENDYYLRFENVVGENTTQTPYEVLVLKENLLTGETWNQEVNNHISYTELNLNDVPQRTRIENKVIAKDVAMTINGVRYEKVVNIEAKYFDASDNTYLYTISTWFAKEVGVARQLITNGNDFSQTKVLQDYIVN
nr:hypothetical protein [uncultured Flavobacterium sp.]